MAEVVLESERMEFFPWEATDEMAVALYEYARHPKVGPSAGWEPHATPRHSLEIIQNMFIPEGDFAIRLKATGEIIGSIGLMPDRHRPDIASREIGYSLSFVHWGHGLMPEAVQRFLAYGFDDLGLDIICATIYPGNLRSQAVVKKCGFVYEGTERMACKGYDGSFRDSQLYSITRDEYYAAHSAAHSGTGLK